MGRYLLNNKIYDTEKAQEIIKYIKPIEHNGVFFKTYPKYEHTLYKTQKGKFFLHIGEYVRESNISYKDKDYIELLSADEVKEILNRLNEIEKYEELFDDLEDG
jgi:hypothetical protein